MKEVLLSDWTLAAVKQREEDRRRKAQAEPTPVALKRREENQRGEAILLSDWTLAAVKQREEDRRRHEREERLRAKETFVSDSLITFNQKEEERREKQKEEKQRAEEPPLIDPILVMKQKEEERRKEELAAEVAVVTVKQAEIAEARIVPLEAEAARRAKGGPREREKAEPIFRVVENTLQRERQETRAVPKRVVVRSRATTKMIRGVLSTLITAAIWGAIGFGVGVYATPPDKADEFRAFVNSKLDEINGLMHRERAAIEPKAKAPSQAAAPIAPEAAPKEIQSAVPAQPAAEAPAADTTGREYLPDNNAIAPSATPTEKSDSPTAPAPSTEPVAPVTSATPATPTNAENVEQPKPVAKKPPVAKPHAKAPVKKPKPKPKPAQHRPEAAPAEQTPPAEAPAQ